MKVYQLVAAAVLRVSVGLSWTQLGSAFGISKDQARHRLNNFKEKYNVVDDDVVAGWNRDFLATNTPENEKAELKGATIIPGDITQVNGATHVFTNAKGNTVFLDSEAVVRTGFVPNPRGVPAAPIIHEDEDEPSELIDNPTFARDEDWEVTSVVPEIEPLQFLITPTVLVVVRDGEPLTIDKSHKNFEKIQTSLKAGEWQSVLDFIDMKNTLTKFSNGRVLVQDGKVTLDGEIVHGKVVNRLVNSLLEENVEALESLAAFLARCDENPDHRVVTRIYDFIAHNDLRLDKEGFILAYKVVRHDYLDKYTGTMSNKPGLTVKMKRNKVNPKDEETCSFGLHVAARRYIPSYGSPSLHQGGDRVVLCRVDPKDFVSIPTDYNSMKARVCEYLVLKDVTELFVKGEVDDEEVGVNT